jgi:hypothetical protein
LQETDQRRQALIEAINEGLSILGESGMKAMYFHIQNITSVKKEDIPDNLEALHEGLEKIFGAGAKMIETAIVRSLRQKLGVQCKEEKSKSFVDSTDDVLKVAGGES